MAVKRWPSLSQRRKRRRKLNIHSVVIHRWSYAGRLRKMSSRPGTESIQVFTWNFHPGMKFQTSAEDRDEQISPRFHVNTKRQITRQRDETRPGMSSLM